MDNQTVTKIKEAIGKSNNIGIVVGRDSTLDRMAAALSLYLLLRNANKKVCVASPSEPIVEISSLVGIDRVQSTLGGDGGDLVVSFPYIEGEIEKVSYTLEKGSLNIIVKASDIGLSFSEKDVQYSRGGGNVDLLIIIGTSQLSEIEPIYAADKLKTTKIINIDNNPKNQGFGDVVAIYPQASSLSEQIADMALLLGLQIDQDSAQNLLSGIITATKNFQEPNTSSLAFEMASYLMKQGAVRERNTTAPRREDKFPAPVPTQPRVAPRQEPVSTNTQKQQTNLSNVHQRQQPQPDKTDEDDSAPQDWLSPKVYRGSSEV